MTTTFTNWQRYELLRGTLAGKPIMALLMASDDGETAYRFSLDDALQLGQHLTAVAAVLRKD